MTEANPAPLIAETLFPLLCRAVVVDQDALQVDVRHGAGSSTVAVTPSRAETGNVIGKKGRSARSFQLLAKLVGEKHGWPIHYTVLAPPGKNPPSVLRPPVAKVRKWNTGETVALLSSTLSAFLLCEPTATVTVLDIGTHSTLEVMLGDGEPQFNATLLVTAPPKEGVESDPIRINGDEAVQAALRTIFGAIGKQHGRTIYVTLIRRGGSMEPQPATAAGRYARERL